MYIMIILFRMQISIARRYICTLHAPPVHRPRSHMGRGALAVTWHMHPCLAVSRIHVHDAGDATNGGTPLPHAGQCLKTPPLRGWAGGREDRTARGLNISSYRIQGMYRLQRATHVLLAGTRSPLKGAGQVTSSVGDPRLPHTSRPMPL